jgi:myo-inositol-1(or 4)-monophosphatase
MSTKELAVQVAKEAGALIRSYHERGAAVRAKGQSYNLVTEADLESEKLIISRLKEAFPEHAILAEETSAATEAAEHLWVIDPLDGTNNFAHSFPFFSVSIAFWRDGKPVVGVVYDPLRDELFTAERGQGAFLNEQPVRVSPASSLSESVLATGFFYERGEMMRRTLRQIQTFFEKPIRGIRRTGSAAMDLCYVAAGRLDGFWELRLSPWDYAAGGLIVSEAGGRVTDVTGGPFDLFMGNVCASNGQIHDDVLEVVMS